MRGTITIQADAKSVQHLTSLRQQATAAIEHDPDCTILSAHNARDTASYTLVGVQDGQRVEHQVEATDEAGAEGLAPDGMVVTDVKAT